MEVKTEDDSNDNTECSQENGKPAIGMFVSLLLQFFCF